ncbi:MAG: nuclear transport factor 2 family protein [Novosphingobium sp.]
MSKENEELVRHFLSLWATRDAAGMVECFAEDGVYDNVPEEKPMAGRAAIRAWLDMCFQHLTRIDVEILNISSSGEWVLDERIDDHIVGEKHMRLPVMNATRIVDGKIVLFRDYYCRVTVKDLGIAG